jgi:hypothetical protein
VVSKGSVLVCVLGKAVLAEVFFFFEGTVLAEVDGEVRAGCGPEFPFFCGKDRKRSGGPEFSNAINEAGYL